MEDISAINNIAISIIIGMALIPLIALISNIIELIFPI